MIKSTAVVWSSVYWGRLADFGAQLMAFGPLGVFLICLLDSAFIPLPTGPDLAVIALSAVNPRWMPVYALAATLGSTVGCAVLYGVARRGGARVLRRVSPERRHRIENLLGRYDMLAVMVPALLPPPFPFKVFVLSAGVFKLQMARFVAGIVIGRAVRYLAEGWLAVQYGEEAGRIIGTHGWKVLVFVAGAVGVWLVLRTLKQRSARMDRLNQTESEPTSEDL